MQTQCDKKNPILRPRANNNLRFEIGQEIGLVDESNKIGLTQPTTGADTLTKTDYGNDCKFNPGV